MVNLLLIGANGQMGKRVQSVADKDFRIFGMDKRKYGVVFSDFNEVDVPIDVVLDFSTSSALSSVVEFCKEKKVPLVSAVTGYDEIEMQRIDELSKFVPVLHSGNFSLGISVINEILNILSTKLPDYEIEIVESHHKNKKDVPSGTCKMFLLTLSKSRNLKEVYRTDTSSKREFDEIGIHSIRGGSVVGEHSVMFFGDDEVIEIKHTAISRDLFALGALKVCKWILNKEIGRYEIEDYKNEKGL